MRSGRPGRPTHRHNDHTAETNSEKNNASNLAKRLHDTTVNIVTDGEPTAKPLSTGLGFRATCSAQSVSNPTATLH